MSLLIQYQFHQQLRLLFKVILINIVYIFAAMHSNRNHFYALQLPPPPSTWDLLKQFLFKINFVVVVEGIGLVAAVVG